jgi:DNA-binding response OmpR family regulator
MRQVDDPVVLLLTDDRPLGESVRFFFQRGGLPASVQVVYGDTPDGSDAINQVDIEDGPGDVVVLPVRWMYTLFETSNVEGTPVIAYGGSSAISEAFILGCCDYLREPWDAEELWARVSRQAFEVRIGYAWGALSVLRDRVVGPLGELPLSYPEYRILAMLARHRGGVVTRQALYFALWGREAPDSRVVDMHVSHIRKKLHVVVPPGNGELIETAHGQGYCLF